jgi:HEAT repeat protein
MTKRRAVWLGIALLVLPAFAVLIPGSPVYLPTFFATGGRYQGQPTRHWIASLDSGEAQARYQAIYALGAIGAEAEEAVPALAKILTEDPDHEARHQAAMALSKMDPASRAAAKALARALADAEPIVRMNAAIALFRLRAEARPAVPALIQALRDESNQTNLGTFHATIQEMAALALGRASGGSPSAVGALTEVLTADCTEETRIAVARALGEIGAPARSAAPLLRAMLRDQNLEVRQAGREALVQIGGAAARNLDQAKDDRPAAPELPEAERKYLWDIEHHGNLLVKHGFGPFAAALRTADAAALSRLLADDFTGTDLGRPHCVRAVNDYAQVERLQESGNQAVPLNRADFVARLLEFRKVFADQPPQVKFALMTLSPQRRGRLDGGWEGTAQLRLHGEHARGAPAEVVVVLRYQVPRPTPQALSRPGWLRAANILQVATAKAPRYLFAEVARQRGLDASQLHDNWKAATFRPTPGGVYVCDFNRDGILDVLITDINGCALYQGCPDGTFRDVTARCGLPRAGLAPPVAAWVDIDGDGWEDLILGNRVYRNERGERFTDYTGRCNLRLPHDAVGVVVADYDRDGKLDLYVTRTGRPGGKSWLEGKSADPRGNFLFRNKGGWQFEDVTKVSGTRGGRRSTFTAAWLDANNDGWPDLHVANEFGDGVLLINQKDGTFRPRALADRPADFGTMGLAVGDINNDGNIDIYCANMYSKAGTRVIGNLAPDAYSPEVLEKMRRFVAGSQLHLNQGGLKFKQSGSQMRVAGVGWAYGACLADLDNDGWLDLYATAGYVSRNRQEPDG